MTSIIQPEIKIEHSFIEKTTNNYPFLIKRETQDKKIFLKGGDWSLKENTKYIVFLENNAQSISGKAHSQLWDLYKRMAKFIKSRNYRQCKSHHQKQISKHQAIPDIISTLMVENHEILNEIDKARETYFYFQERNKQKIVSEKEEKVDLIKTADSYDQEEELISQRKRLATFPQAIYRSAMPVSMNGFKNEPLQVMKKPSTQDWLECHHLFLQYVTKLNSIKMREFV